MYATPPPSASTAAPLAATTPPVSAHDPSMVGAHAAATWSAAPAQAAPPTQQIPPQRAPQQSAGASWMTGVYEPSGDPAIDRMIRLEAACKRFGSLI